MAKAKKDVTLSQEQFDNLMNRLNSLEENKTQTVTQEPTRPPVDQFGKPTGIIQKYSVDPAHYKDPRKALSLLKELERVAFDVNYMLDWEVQQLIYETKFGTSFSEPKFTLVLYRRMFDEDGNPTDKRMLIQRGIFFEDPAASIKEAVDMGLPVDNANSSEFLESMRFERYKRWLLDIFNPKKLGSTKRKVTEQVIGGKVVEVEEYSIAL